MSALRRRLAADSGFTVVELVVVALVGTLLMLAALGTVSAAARRSVKTQDRVEALQDGRRAISDSTRLLRSMSCPDGVTTPLIEATATSVKFYADLDADTDENPRVWELALEPAVNGRQRFVARRYVAGSTTQVESTRTLLSSFVAPRWVDKRLKDGEVPVYRWTNDRVDEPIGGIFSYYWEYKQVIFSMYKVPLQAPDLAKVARIDVNLGTQPANTRGPDTQVNLRGSLAAPSGVLELERQYFSC